MQSVECICMSSCDSTNTCTTSTTAQRTKSTTEYRSLQTFQTTIYLSVYAEQQWMQPDQQYTAGVCMRYIAVPTGLASSRQSSLLSARSSAFCIDRSLQVVDLVYRRCVCAWRRPTARYVGYHSHAQRETDR